MRRLELGERDKNQKGPGGRPRRAALIVLAITVVVVLLAWMQLRGRGGGHFHRILDHLRGS